MKYSTRQIWIDGIELFPMQSQSVVNHSPDGFNWGPVQLVILLAWPLDPKIATKHYIEFSFQLYLWMDVKGVIDE